MLEGLASMVQLPVKESPEVFVPRILETYSQTGSVWLLMLAASIVSALSVTVVGLSYSLFKWNLKRERVSLTEIPAAMSSRVSTSMLASGLAMIAAMGVYTSCLHCRVRTLGRVDADLTTTVLLFMGSALGGGALAYMILDGVDIANRRSLRSQCCHKCGYSVVGLIDKKCPECGFALREASPDSGSRRSIGGIGRVVLWGAVVALYTNGFLRPVVRLVW